MNSKAIPVNNDTISAGRRQEAKEEVINGMKVCSSCSAEKAWGESQRPRRRCSDRPWTTHCSSNQGRTWFNQSHPMEAGTRTPPRLSHEMAGILPRCNLPHRRRDMIRLVYLSSLFCKGDYWVPPFSRTTDPSRAGFAWREGSERNYAKGLCLQRIGWLGAFELPHPEC